jgi:TRAP-type C4-dicarboxylate transport system substrate-binding protein
VVGEATLAAIAKAEEMSNGRLQFTPYWDGNYVSYDESIQSTINGVVDICYVDAGNLNEVFYLNQLLTMPYTCNLPSRLGAHEVMQQVLKEIPEINEELEAVGLTWLGLTNMGGMVIHFSKDVEVRTPNDIKGMILDAPANAGTLVQSLGATATAMVATEFYTSLERGVVDGLFHNWDAYDVFAMNEVCKAHTIFSGEDGGLWAAGSGYVMNLNSWNNLPEDLQEIMRECFDFWGKEWATLSIPIAEKGWSDAKEAGHTFTYLTNEERELWIDAIRETNPIILDKIEQAGFDAYGNYDKLMELFEAKWEEEQNS